MEKKKGFGDRLEAFFAGKGFYIVLFLCVAVIGVSAYAMLAGNGTDVENGFEANLAVSEEPELVGTPPDVTLSGPEVINEAPHVNLPELETASEPAPAEEVYAETAAQEETAPAADFFVMPVAGTVENGYSMDSLAYDRTMRDWRTHDGIDFACALGDNVKAVSGGTVTRVYSDDLYGTTVEIDHGSGLKSSCSNLASVPTVAEGDMVSPGQVIGSVGDTALCETGEVTHLHFSMSLDGESVDPGEYLPG